MILVKIYKMAVGLHIIDYIHSVGENHYQLAYFCA